MPRRLLLLALPILSLVTGCSEDPVQIPPESESPAVWQRLDVSPGITDEALFDLRARDGDLFVLGQKFFATIDETGTTIDSWPRAIPGDYRLPFAGTSFFAYPLTAESQSLRSISINWGAGSGSLPSEMQLPLDVLDPTLAPNARYVAENMPVAAIADDNRMLVAVWNECAGDCTRHLLYEVNLNASGSGSLPELSFDVERRIERPVFERVLTTGTRLFASSAFATVEILNDGGIRQLLDDGTWSLIEHDNRLFACNWQGLRVSEDDGLTWSFLSHDGGYGEFFVVGGQLCLLRGMMLFRIDPDAGTMTRLAHDGLPYGTHLWRAAVQFGNRVYVATRDGLFVKPVSEFFEPGVSG